MKHGRVAEAKALVRKLHNVGVTGARSAAIEREVEGMEGNKDEEQKSDPSLGEVSASERTAS